MKRALRCVGFVLLGIAGAFVAACTACAVLFALFWLGDQTAQWFGLPDKYGALFYLGYTVSIVGGLIGAAMCRDARA